MLHAAIIGIDMCSSRSAHCTKVQPSFLNACKVIQLCHVMDLRHAWPCKPADNLAISEHCISRADGSFGGGIRHQNVGCDMSSVFKQQIQII